jgi:hypothetical protein
MDAKQLVRETLQNSFDKERFIYFVKNLLNTIDDSKAFHARGYVPEIFKDYVKTYERIGTYTDPQDKKIDILIVYLQKETSLDRARTAQRNFIARYLKDRGEKDAGLVAFVPPTREDWRFSFVKMEYKMTETPKGAIKAKEEFTPARRYSFLVGSNESSHTAQRQLVPILSDDKNYPTLNNLEEAFRIEKVTKEFFEEYRRLFLDLKEALDELLKKDSKIRQDFKSKNIDTVDFAKKLLGQIVFLYFLQKKGWFGVTRDADWGTGPKNFLRQLFEKKIANYSNFFNDILEPLFYEALAVERSDNFYSRFNCKIPFLNGGLFDPINNYDWVHTDIILPDELFSNKIKTKEGDIGTGILDVFDRYNFTVKEDEPLEKEVAVDPEMLGKVFENLLEVKDRKSRGTYYTPREIVHYMCQESLINYLATELEGKVNKKDIETLIKYGETAVEHDMRVINEGRETSKYSFKLPESIRKHAKLIDEKLATIRICDPAVGSGAFPVGMMNEIVRTRNALTPYLSLRGAKATKQSRTIYDFKRHAIQNCLYGVDIDLSAVEIAKLRLWLSLIVDEEDIKQIKPLPNLDYKIVQGNSLLGVEKNLFNLDLFSKLEELKPLFFNETNARKKQAYKEQIDKLITQITNGRKDFDFEVYFSEVFHEKKGFDVVIANPPYISYGLRGGQKMTKQEKDYLRKQFPNSAEYKISMYAIFMDRAIQISKPTGGLQTFIVPDSYLLGRYFSKIRSFILRSNEIIYILLLPFSVFEATVGFSVVYLFQRKKDVDAKHMLIARYSENTDHIMKGKFKELSYPQSYFYDLKYNRFRLFFDKNTMSLILKIEKDSSELGDFMTGRTGVRSLIGQKNIIAKQKKSKTWQKGLISGSQICKYKIIYEGDYINIDPKLLNKGGWDYNVIHSPKLLLRQTGDSLTAAVDFDGLYHLNNIHSFALDNSKLDLLYLLALINSNLLNYYYKNTSLETNRTMAQTDIETLESLPIKAISQNEQKPFIDLVNKILVITKDNDYLENPTKQAKVKEYERQIDRMVYKLYGLTEEEIKIVEEFNR